MISMNRCSRVTSLALAAAALLGAQPSPGATLADQPVFASADVPGNLALTLSVEYPTAISVANLGNYADSSTYLGYFDPLKCYTYTLNTATPASRATSSILHGTRCSRGRVSATSEIRSDRIDTPPMVTLASLRSNHGRTARDRVVRSECEEE